MAAERKRKVVEVAKKEVPKPGKEDAGKVRKGMVEKAP